MMKRQLDETLDALEKRLGPDMTLGQRELVAVRLRGLPIPPASPAERRAEKITAFLRELDQRDFGPLRAKLKTGEYGPADYRAQIQSIPHYDLDGWTRRLFALHDEPEYSVQLAPDMVGHVTTHAIQILEMASELGPDDLFFDLGSGMGLVPIMIGWLTGARSIGVELEPRFVAIARARATELGIGDRVTFIEGDLRAQDYSGATAMYMFYPCRDELLAEVVRKMEQAAAGRAVKVYSLGLSSPVLAQEKWLEVRGQSPSGLVALQTRA